MSMCQTKATASYVTTFAIICALVILKVVPTATQSSATQRTLVLHEKKVVRYVSCAAGLMWILMTFL